MRYKDIEPKIGCVRLLKTHGAAWIYRTNEIGLDHVVLTHDAMMQIQLAQNEVPLLYDGQSIGQVYSLVKLFHTKTIQVFFNYNLPELETDEAQLIAVPNLHTDRIGCVLCSNWFNRRDKPCTCIFEAPVIMVEHALITSVSLLDIKHEHIEDADHRQKMIHTHFAGAFTNFVVSDPI